jgi:hypothetical protein
MMDLAKIYAINLLEGPRQGNAHLASTKAIKPGAIAWQARQSAVLALFPRGGALTILR